MPSSKKAKTKQRASHEPWNDQAELLRIIAHPTRLAILEALSNGSQCVKDLNSLVPVPQPHLSQHIAALRKAKLVDNHAAGNLRCYYILRPTLIKGLIRILIEEHPVHYRDRVEVHREVTSKRKTRQGSTR